MDRQPGSRTGQAAPPAYTITSYRTSHFKLNDSGDLELRAGVPYDAEGVYRFRRTLQPQESAVVVMDPFADLTSDYLNDYVGRIVYSRLVPLVERASRRGHPVIILTNDPRTVLYGSRIYPELQALVAEGKAAPWYHRHPDNGAFANYLRSNGVRSLIYTGFASNLCVIGREDGIIAMKNQGFDTYFVPDASAAMEYADSWKNQAIHKATTQIISQGFAEIIDYDEFMQAAP